MTAGATTATATAATVTARTRSCAADLLTNGIDVHGMPDDALRALIARERDYFQLMLGAAEPSDREIFHLLRGNGQAHGRVQPRSRAHARRRRPR
jgi:hypothetical protein